jgi:NAD(P)-dependent dehydrogenase (short-subunit alcohol dehydrogenase family)
MLSGHSLAGKHALVTGGGRGIGAAIAHALLTHGARVTLAGRNIQILADTAGELKSFGEVDHLAVDVAQRESVAQAFGLAATRFGRIDILINNAGQAVSAPFMKTDETLWQQMLDVNLTGTFHCTQAALPAMLENGWGRIVNVASTAGLAAGARSGIEGRHCQCGVPRLYGNGYREGRRRQYRRQDRTQRGAGIRRTGVAQSAKAAGAATGSR